jgi:ferritin-like metal-binding protein YciE
MEHPMKTLADLFEHTLQDVYYAEHALTKALKTMQGAAGSAELKAAFAEHLKETKDQIKILDQVFEMTGLEAKGEKCDAIDGIIKEGEGVIEESEGVARDAGLVAAAQAAEHYEIARYGTLKEWAVALGHDDAAAHLDRILMQEKACNNKLTALAVDSINKAPRKRAAPKSK